MAGVDLTRIAASLLRTNTAGPSQPAAPSVELSSASPSVAQPKDHEALQAAASQLKVDFGVEVKLELDEETGRQVVKIFSPDGRRLLRQIPPEQLLKMAARARREGLKSLLESVV